MKHSIKFSSVLFFLCVNCFVLKAQQKHFIYVQSEDKQPFAVVLGGKVFSSSDYGYVIIPKLADSTYKFTVSFPMNKYPDQYFICTVNKKDVGYTLKNQSEGWALQNLQTQKLVMNSAAAATTSTAFGDMLSDVVNDSTLTKSTTAQMSADTTANIPATVAGTAAVVAAVTGNSGADSLQQPQKISEEKLDTGTNMLFVDKTQNGIDTINVFVPNETSIDNTTATAQQTIPETTTNPAAVIPVPVNNDSVAQNNSSSVPESTTANNNNELPDTTTHGVSNPFYKPEQNATSTAIVAGTTMSNQSVVPAATNAMKEDCSNMISDNDLEKLKRKMFVQKSNNDMVQYAVKYLNKKCITTDQVKDLGNLFSSDDGRYSLFDALYDYTYDYGNYSTLANQILDPYYKKRFAAMLR